MNADEMFEELEYKKFDNHPEHDLPPEPNMWSTQDCRVIDYTAEATINGHHCLQRISFEMLSKRIICEGFCDGRVTRAIPFSAEEIQAINKKCQELGWLEEER